MHRFKISNKWTAQDYDIDRVTFEKITGKRRPWYPTPDELNPYALCPWCDNPIQIVGLYKVPKNTDNPYGRHTGKDIPSVARHSQMKYEYCPFASHSRAFGDPEERTDETEWSQEIKGLFIEECDAAVWVLQTSLGIKLTDKRVREIVKAFADNRGWLYPGITKQNLPYILGYLFARINLFGQGIKIESELDQVLRTELPNIRREVRSGYAYYLSDKGGRFYSIRLSMLAHKRNVINHEIDERFELILGIQESGDLEEKTYIIADCKVQQDFFIRVINSPQRKRVEAIREFVHSLID